VENLHNFGGGAFYLKIKAEIPPKHPISFIPSQTITHNKAVISITNFVPTKDIEI